MQEAKRQRTITDDDEVEVEVGSLPEELFPFIFSNFDVRMLIEKKVVCRKWKRLCTNDIDAKRTTASTRKVFETNRELKKTL
jgi:hypothetical protein